MYTYTTPHINNTPTTPSPSWTIWVFVFNFTPHLHVHLSKIELSIEVTSLQDIDINFVNCTLKLKKNWLSTFITLNETIMPYPQPLESFQMFPRIVQNLQNNQENLACNDSKLKSSNDFLNFNKLTNENIYIYTSI
jgi:hypothetical protein